MSKPSTTKKAPKTNKTKPSGVEWLGDIPEHWEVRRNLGIFDERQESNQPDAELLSVTITRGVIKQSEITTKKDSSNDDKSKYKVIKKGDLAYNKMRAWQGALGISAYDGICSPAYIVLTPKNPKLSKYFHYLFRTPMFIEEANRLSYGLCDDMNTLRYEHFKTSYSPIPPDDELDKIVAFLDRKTSQIDALIEKKQRLLKLLDEQLAIKINNAVTKGIVNAQYGTLNPHLSTKTTPIYTTHTSSLKKSGIEWIGEIPEEWKLIRFKRILKQICDGPFGSSLTSAHYSESGTQVIRLSNIGKGIFKNKNKAYIPDKYAAKLHHHKVLKDDLLIAGLGDSNHPVGRTCIYSSYTEAIVKADCYRARLVNSYFNNYISEYLSSTTGASSFAAQTRGSTRSRANLEITKNIFIVLPTKPESQQLANYIKKIKRFTLKGKQHINSQIANLYHYRNQCISLTVTGNSKSIKSNL